MRQRASGRGRTRQRIVFLHAVEEGPASQSYGIEVAALAGVPGQRDPRRPAPPAADGEPGDRSLARSPICSL
ncbi:MAG: hypothetical protein MZW92_25270 [Comamonadaceae bacterium]|nr:hypothetical protein [Comamonadaceae bacterium]